jgi:hypothetical protein
MNTDKEKDNNLSTRPSMYIENIEKEIKSWGISIALFQSLSCAVTLHILEIKKQGFITDKMRESAIDSAEKISTGADSLFYKGDSVMTTKLVFNKLAYAIAIMAFQPGGVCFCNQQYEAKL